MKKKSRTNIIIQREWYHRLLTAAAEWPIGTPRNGYVKLMLALLREQREHPVTELDGYGVTVPDGAEDGSTLKHSLDFRAGGRLMLIPVWGTGCNIRLFMVQVQVRHVSEIGSLLALIGAWTFCFCRRRRTPWEQSWFSGFLLFSRGQIGYNVTSHRSLLT